MKILTDWRQFAQRLTNLAVSEGHERFFDEAFILLNELVTVDSCAVFKVAADKTSGADHLCTFGVLDKTLADLLANDYVTNGFKNDPMVQTALPSSSARVRQLPNSQYSDEYRSTFFKKAGLIDKVTSLHASKNVIFLVSYYRLESNGAFSGDDFKDLQRLAPILGRSVFRHVQLSQEGESLEKNYEQRIARLLDDNTQIFFRLAPRERNVCKSILLGHEEKKIADELGVKLNTIITHRRRIYSKLNINSKSELYKITLMALS